MKSTAFSILERIDVGETARVVCAPGRAHRLSVSSNGSTWVKLFLSPTPSPAVPTFSILERIDVGETWFVRVQKALSRTPFSILERIDVGETCER